MQFSPYVTELLGKETESIDDRYFRVAAAYSTNTSLGSLNFVRPGHSGEQAIHHKFGVAERVQAARVASQLELTYDLCP